MPLHWCLIGAALAFVAGAAYRHANPAAPRFHAWLDSLLDVVWPRLPRPPRPEDSPDPEPLPPPAMREALARRKAARAAEAPAADGPPPAA